MAIFVVCLHGNFLKDISLTGSYLTVNGLFRIAVPTFLLINGYFFFYATQDKTLKIWFLRISYLYLIWMIVFSYYWFKPPIFSVGYFIKLLFNIFVGYHHLWYFPAIIGAAIVVLILDRNKLSYQISIIILTFFIGLFVQYSGNYHIMSNLFLDKLFNYSWSYRNFLFFGFPYFYIGFLINKYKIQKIITVKTSLSVFSAGLFLLFLESYANYVNPTRDGGFSHYLSLLLVCPAIFMFVINLNVTGNSRKIALFSTSVYLIHPLFIHLSKDILSFSETRTTLIAILLSLLSSFLLVRLKDRFNYII